MEKETFNAVTLDLENIKAEILFDSKALLMRIPTTPKEGSQFVHIHTYSEVFFVADTPLKIVTETGEHYYRNTVVIVPPYFKHYSSVLKEDIYCFRIRFKQKNAENENFYQRITELFSSDQLRCAPKNEQLIFCLHELNATMNENTETAKEKAKALLTLILLNLFETLHMQYPNAQKSAPARHEYLFHLERIVNFEYTENIDLSYVAERLHLSKKQTSRFIRKEFGVPLSTLVTDKRLSVAAKLLKTTDKSVAEIINELNFQTESYFFVLFKKKYGQTPLAFRKRKNGKNG